MKRLLSLLILLFVVSTLFAGCANDDPGASVEPSTSSAPDNTITPDASEEPVKATYPLVDTPTTLTCYWPLNVTDITDLAETQYFQEAAKITGVTIQFDHPSGTEAFGLMIASQDYADMIKQFYTSYGQGVDFAIDNDIIQPLEDFTQYMPNYMALINGNDEIKLNSYSDNGHLWGINQIVDKPQDPWCGPVVRQDMLDDIGYTKTPITVDDWEDMLTQLKDNIPSLATGPFQLCAHGGTSVAGTLTSAYGIDQTRNFNVHDKKVVYPVLEPGFRDYVTRMNQWWNKGLIYNDYITETFVYGPFELVLNDKFAVFDTIYNWFDTNYKAASPDPDFQLVGLPLPKLNPNDKLHVRNTNGWTRVDNSLCITTACENVPLAVQYWDFSFTEEGKILGNYGVEGISFEYDAQGNPQYTELVTKYETGIQSAMTRYVLFNAPGFCIPTREQQGLSEISIQATKTWVESAGDDWVYPAGAVMTAEEGAEYSALFNDIGTYVNENTNLFIMGQRPLDQFDDFIAQIKSMGIDRCIELRQASVDRYYNRLNIVE